MLQTVIRFDRWLIDQIVQPVLDRFGLSPEPTARALLFGAIVLRITASAIQLHVLDTLAWLALLGEAIRTLPHGRALARTPQGVYLRSTLLLVNAMLDPFLDLNLRGDAAFFGMLLSATAAFYVLAGTPGLRRRAGSRSLRLSP